MIYRSTRPYPISLSNAVTGQHYVIEAYSLTPDLPEGMDKVYEGILVPLITPGKIVRGVGERDSELFESSTVNDGFFESEEEDSELIPLNETVKKGRGRPKKIV